MPAVLVFRKRLVVVVPAIPAYYPRSAGENEKRALKTAEYQATGEKKESSTRRKGIPEKDGFEKWNEMRGAITHTSKIRICLYTLDIYTYLSYACFDQ